MDAWSPLWMIATLGVALLLRRPAPSAARLAACERRIDALELADTDRRRTLAQLGF